MNSFFSRFFGLGALLFLAPSSQAQLPDYAAYPVYEGKDLGLNYAPAQSVFRVWAPTAKSMTLRFYSGGEPTDGNPDLLHSQEMVRDIGGTWYAAVSGELKGLFYTFQAQTPEGLRAETPDPYARAVGVNGHRAVVIDMLDTHPPGWQDDKAPALASTLDAVIYELHVRDATLYSDAKHPGKFLGLAQPGLKNQAGQSAGLDHLRELGITHVHLLPLYDYFTVDETVPDNKTYNWGYDPLNYNVPEGSYSTNPYHAAKRIIEFKQLVLALHTAGIRVVMDVVYNHTMFGENSNFNQLVPGYYYRQTADGGFSNASACGNETASERPMMRKFILESLKYWMKEYHIDGFRFDLMGIHDIETMNMIAEELRAIDPLVLLYGEGWTAGSSPLPEAQRALKKYTYRLDGVAAFSDDLRDGLKGSVFDHHDRGFASGKAGMEMSLRFGIAAATRHPQVDYKKVNYSDAPWAGQPGQCINYVSCHDNHTLWDKLAISVPEAPEATRIRMHLLAQSVVLTSQGIPFLHAGTEFLRTKQGVENSYNSPDSINALDWNRKSRYLEVNDYIRGLIALRKAHPAFRMQTMEQLAANLRFIEETPAGVVAYTLDGVAAGDSWNKILVVFNANPEPADITCPAGKWRKVVWNAAVLDGAARKKVKGKKALSIPAISAAVLAVE